MYVITGAFSIVSGWFIELPLCPLFVPELVVPLEPVSALAVSPIRTRELADDAPATSNEVANPL